MRLPPLGVRRARQQAIEFLRSHHIARPTDLSIEAMAGLVGLQVERGRLDGALAHLLRVGDVGTIRVADRITHPGAHRFSVAHELGHVVLQHPTPDAAALCSGPRTHADSGTEAEANGFATELLMPERLLRRRCEVSPVSLAPARAIADEFAVSLMAAALRFVELTSERCALVFARERRVVWAARSGTFAPFIARGRRLDRASLADDWFTHGRVRDACEEVPADAWLDHDAASDREIHEHAAGVPELNGVMSLLWIPESIAAPFDRA